MMPKPKLLLLHGALGSAEQLEPLASQLQDHVVPLSFTFSGHGGKGALQHPFRIESFAEELQHWLEEQQLSKIPVLGYSMGGYVALYLAGKSQQYFSEILTLGTKFNWTPEGAAREISRLQPAVIAEKVPRFAEMLAQRHQPHDWRSVMQHTAEMMRALGAQQLLQAQELAQVPVPVTVMRGSEDSMVSKAESQWAAACLPKGRYLALEGQPHPLEQVQPAVLAQAVMNQLIKK